MRFVISCLRRGFRKPTSQPPGYGKAKPVADNATAQGRAQNRRVQLVVSGDRLALNRAARILRQSYDSSILFSICIKTKGRTVRLFCFFGYRSYVNSQGKTVFITGASSGIGRSTANRVCAEGARLAVCARRLETAGGASAALAGCRRSRRAPLPARRAEAR